MDFGGRLKSRKLQNNADAVDDRYPHRLQLYTTPPSDTISLQEFEELAVERLKVLKAIETIGISHTKGNPKYCELLEKEIMATKLKDSFLRIRNNLTKDEEIENRRLDHASHFILRLAYCRSEDLRRWFLMQELDLFRFRFQQENTESRARFLASSGLKYKPISKEERNYVVKELDGTDHITDTSNLEYYKVPFTECLDLVRGRKVYLKRGYAYVPRDDLVSILLSVFRASLSHALAITARALPSMEEDGRLLPMLCGLSKRYLGQNYDVKQNVGVVTADMIDTLSKKSFPLCMQNLHIHLRQNHHLKHFGRMQYGLYLKGIGLSLEEAMKYFRMEFTKSMDVDTFDKRYSYGIRYNYGKEGQKKDYSPFACMKIIMNNAPATGDAHGCPFRHFESEFLKQRISNQGLSKDGVESVMKYAKGGHCQVACAKYFELSHGISDGGTEVEMVIQHPNQYFENSQKLLKGPARPISTPRSVKIVSSQQSQPSTPSTPVSSKKSQIKPEPIEDESMDDDMGLSQEELDALDCP